jgi:VWFA-related protein
MTTRVRPAMRAHARFAVAVAVLGLAAGVGLVAPGRFAGIAHAQDTPPAAPSSPSQFGEKIDVREVLLDALVTDPQGNVILGLDKNDFDVRENGRPVELSGVTFYSNRRLIEGSEALAKRGIQPDQVPENRYFILFFQDQRTHAAEVPSLLGQQVEAGRRAREWVQTVLPNDYVAVVAWDYKLKVLSDFTSDHQALAEAVEASIQGKDPEKNWPSRTPSNGPSLLAGLPSGNALRDKTATIYDAIDQVATAAGKITGRKNLVLFSIGFGRLNGFAQYIEDPRYYRPMVERLNTANVAVYTVDLMPIGARHTMSDALNGLAADTGGRYFYDVVNYNNPLNSLAKENSGYYLLSYTARHPAGKSGFQDVQVQVKNPDFKVRARKGYLYGK